MVSLARWPAGELAAWKGGAVGEQVGTKSRHSSNTGQLRARGQTLWFGIISVGLDSFGGGKVWLGRLALPLLLFFQTMKDVSWAGSRLAWG